jgi:hypothetical protein
MPRNPDKTRCTVPGCRAWAMHGHTRCRAHLDAELGPRGAGAPLHNLNALKHGQHSDPLPEPDFQCLVVTAVERPDDLALQVGLAVRRIQDRTGDPFLTLVALRRLLSRLVDGVADALFTAELCETLRPLPPSVRERLQERIERLAVHKRPEDNLLLLRSIRKRRKTIAGTGTG